jgi:nucleoside-diphosphate-sugar epimerase
LIRSPLDSTGQTPLLTITLNNPETWVNLLPLTNHEIDVYFLLPPSQIEQAALRDFVTLMGTWQIRRMVMSSSTVVYGSQSRIVDADSEVNIDTARAERQYSIEQNMASSGIELKIVRLAGLYASDRIIGKQAILDGQALSGKGDNWLDLIHTTDAANLLIEVMASETASSIEMGSDGNPVRRAKYYGDLANYYSREVPAFRNEKTERGEGRRCENSITVERTGWRAAITDYRKGWLI